MLRHLGFSHAICAILQQRRNRFPFRVRRHHRHHFAVLTVAMRGQTADSGDGKLRARKRFFRELIPLDNLNPSLNRLVRRAQIRRFIRPHFRLHLDQLGNISCRIVMFAHGISALVQRRRQGKACFVRRHAARRIAGSIIEIKLNACNRHTVQRIGFHHADITLCRLVFRFDGIGFSVLRAVDFGYKTAIYIVFGNACFGNPISTPLQPSCFRRTVCACRQRCDHLANRTAAFRSRQARDRKDRACKRFFRQRVPLYDSDFSVYPVVCKTNVARRARRNRHCLRRIDGDLVARRRANFPHGITTSREIIKLRCAVRARGLCRYNCAGSVHQLKRRTRKHCAVVRTVFAHADSAIRLFKLDAHFL